MKYGENHARPADADDFEGQFPSDSWFPPAAEAAGQRLYIILLFIRVYDPWEAILRINPPDTQYILHFIYFLQ
jgi:hypothetical protein